MRSPSLISRAYGPCGEGSEVVSTCCVSAVTTVATVGMVGAIVSAITDFLVLLLFLGVPVGVVDGRRLVRDLVFLLGAAITRTGDAEAATLLIPPIALTSAGTAIFVMGMLSSGKGAGAS